MSKIKIDKNVPMPNVRGELLKTIKKMEVGDSISLPAKKRTYISSYSKRLGIKMTVRTVGDGVIRVWRFE